MITLETGLPRACKTLYCVDKLLSPLIGTTVKYRDEHDNPAEAARHLYCNIEGLLLPHEKIGAGSAWTYNARASESAGRDVWEQPADADKLGLNNWHEWAKPGTVICYDEIQKCWPKAASGSRVPPCIQALETHGHMGVDFIVITQHPGLIHGNLVSLVGRHLHMRRMGTMNLSIAYEWDSCSKTLLYKNAVTKFPYRFNVKAFGLYKSSVLHTKQPRKMPGLMWLGLAALLGLGYAVPAVHSRVTERLSPKAEAVVVIPPAKITTVVTYGDPPGQTPDKSGPSAPVSAPGPSPAEVPAVEVAGCAQLRGVCRCYDKDALPVDKPASFCAARILPAVPAASLPSSPGVPEHIISTTTHTDGEVLGWMARRR